MRHYSKGVVPPGKVWSAMSALFTDSTSPVAESVSEDPVREVDTRNFMAEVIEASRQNLVIVDFWAPWCGPCKQLTPILEKIVRSYKGCGVRLAKVNIDASPQIAQQMRIQSVPAVFAFFNGQPVDGFMGALPEAQVKSWIERLINATGVCVPNGHGIEAALKQAAEILDTGNAEAAQALYADILKEDPDNALAFAGSLRCLIALGDHDMARQILSQASPQIQRHKALDSVRAMLELSEQTQSMPAETEALKARLDKNPDDHQARFDLALALYALGEREACVEALLEIVQRDRNWNEEAARKQLVKLFEAFGPMDPLTVETRKRLSSILFS